MILPFCLAILLRSWISLSCVCQCEQTFAAQLAFLESDVRLGAWTHCLGRDQHTCTQQNLRVSCLDYWYPTQTYPSPPPYPPSHLYWLCGSAQEANSPIIDAGHNKHFLIDSHDFSGTQSSPFMAYRYAVLDDSTVLVLSLSCTLWNPWFTFSSDLWCHSHMFGSSYVPRVIF